MPRHAATCTSLSTLWPAGRTRRIAVVLGASTLLAGAGTTTAWAAGASDVPVGGGAVGNVMAALQDHCTQTGDVVTCTYDTPGSRSPFTVPTGTTRVSVTVEGAQGASNGTGSEEVPGGRGARVRGDITVRDRQAFTVVVGAAGNSGSAGKGGGGGDGYGPGGSGGDGENGTLANDSGGSGGGGGSAILDGQQPLAVAGGGGGAGGHGGFSPGGDGGADGADGGGDDGGPGGDRDSGGPPAGGNGEAAEDNPFLDAAGGGGGGGGLVGGGGGGEGGPDNITDKGGGGGGASLEPDSGSTDDGAVSGDGSVVITYDAPPKQAPIDIHDIGIQAPVQACNNSVGEGVLGLGAKEQRNTDSHDGDCRQKNKAADNSRTDDTDQDNDNDNGDSDEGEH